MARDRHECKSNGRVSYNLFFGVYKVQTYVFCRSPVVNHADRYLVNIFRRARNRFHNNTHRNRDHQSESGVFTSSSITTLLDNDFDPDEEDFLNDDTDNELLCSSLEAALVEVLIELRESRRQQKSQSNSHLTINAIDDDIELSICTRL